jgi:hypothetical protein
MKYDIDTPCIGICSTIYGDEICRGCKRTYTEVIEWNRYDQTEKKVVFNRLEQAIISVCEQYLTVIDAELLAQQLDKFNIRYRADQHPLCLALYLLREGHDKIHQINKYGISIKLAYQTLSLTELYRMIDNQLLN